MLLGNCTFHTMHSGLTQSFLVVWLKLRFASPPHRVRLISSLLQIYYFIPVSWLFPPNFATLDDRPVQLVVRVYPTCLIFSVQKSCHHSLCAMVVWFLNRQTECVSERVCGPKMDKLHNDELHIWYSSW